MIREKILDEYPKYIIYDDGKIWSKSKRCWMAPSLNSDGYPTINAISKNAKNGYRQTKAIHRLIAIAFIPNPNGYNDINHIDGNKENNHYSNLEWCTKSHNLSHSYKIGLRKIDGIRKSSAKLAEWQVKAIRWLYSYSNKKQKELSAHYGVSQSQISCIIRGEHWKNIPI